MDFGVVVMVLLLVLVMPVGVLLSMAVLAGVIGALIGRQSDLDNVTQDGEPNEYLELSESNPYVL
ncbi:MAG: hypothetical protein OXB90_00445 [Acidimicrobiaceae bacterium]|nr:hypothetical protein [Acidimicrobiaceae bacterium]